MGALLQGSSFLIGYRLLPDRCICFDKGEENEDGLRANETRERERVDEGAADGRENRKTAGDRRIGP